MAPYLGLLTRRGELTGGGYTRKDLSDVDFRISPGEDEGADLTVLNWGDIIWYPLVESDDVIELAVFTDASGDDMIVRSPIGPLPVREGDHLVISAGRLRFGHRFTKDKARRNIDVDTDRDATDRWREALIRIAEAPVNVRSRELRAIARVALLME